MRILYNLVDSWDNIPVHKRYYVFLVIFWRKHRISLLLHYLAVTCLLGLLAFHALGGGLLGTITGILFGYYGALIIPVRKGGVTAQEKN